MGSGAPGEADHAAAMTPPSGAHDHHDSPGGTPLATPGQHHGDSQGCLMILACGASSVRTAQTVAMTGLPAAFERADFFANPIPVAADLAVESPPPRQAA